MARKGIWLPLPGFEIGAGATKIIDSNMYAVQGYAKLALQEGFHDWPIPSLALRGAVSHLLGSPQVDLTVVSVDATVSKSFGIAGTVTLDPYVGAGTLLGIVRGQVIDTTPGVDAFADGAGSNDINANTTFPDPDTIVRWHIWAGFRLVYAFLAFTGEFVYTFCNEQRERLQQDGPDAGSPTAPAVRRRSTSRARSCSSRRARLAQASLIPRLLRPSILLLRVAVSSLRGSKYRRYSCAAHSSGATLASASTLSLRRGIRAPSTSPQ